MKNMRHGTRGCIDKKQIKLANVHSLFIHLSIENAKLCSVEEYEEVPRMETCGAFILSAMMQTKTRPVVLRQVFFVTKRTVRRLGGRICYRKDGKTVWRTKRKK